ncbi:type IX secretion system membrane protein PorP/SprF [Owenweeksia hongkongensis]|uniref:type IX secretion system membrane protein PorP/SprF n=1 Tax=Owenweeksia hongkongensis TaxID=253245 RepID=UPI003A91F614
MFWKKFSASVLLLVVISSEYHAQKDQMAFAKFPVLEDFTSNPALFGYWQAPSFGIAYNGSLGEYDFPNNQTTLFYNQGNETNGFGAEFSRKAQGYSTQSNFKLGYSRSGTVSKSLKWRAGGAIKYAHIKNDYESLLFPDQIDPYYGFVLESSEDLSNNSPSSFVTAELGGSLQYHKLMVNVHAENIAPILLSGEDDQKAEFFSSRSYDYLPATLRVNAVYQFTFANDFFLSPGFQINSDFSKPNPVSSALVNFQWRSIVMANYSYSSNGMVKFMAGGRIKDKLSLTAGASIYSDNKITGYTDRIFYHFSIFTQL